MQSIYARLREQAREIVASFPPPDFYQDQSQAYDYSSRFFKTDPEIRKLCRFVGDNLDDDFGHGLQHAIKVTIDAGALMNIEGQAADYTESVLARQTQIVQCAGLLHDTQRKKKNHSKHSADYARTVLEDYSLSYDEIDDVCRERFVLGITGMRDQFNIAFQSQDFVEQVLRVRRQPVT